LFDVDGGEIVDEGMSDFEKVREFLELEV